jgi:hypothetical protein
MENGEYADTCTEMTLVGSNLEQGLRGCVKQHRIEKPLVA